MPKNSPRHTEVRSRATAARIPLKTAFLVGLVALVGACTPDSLGVGGAPDREVVGSPANIASLSEVIKANPKDPESYNMRGTAFGEAGKLNRAVEDFTNAIALDPSFHEAYANRALALGRLGQLERARQDYNRALQKKKGAATCTAKPVSCRPLSTITIAQSR